MLELKELWEIYCTEHKLNGAVRINGIGQIVTMHEDHLNIGDILNGICRDDYPGDHDMKNGTEAATHLLALIASLN